MTAEEVQARVAVPGGITAKALQLLRRETDGIFNQLIPALLMTNTVRIS